MSILPTDQNGNAIQALTPKLDGGSHKITAAGTSAKNTTAFNATTKLISVCADVPFYYRLGGSSVAAVNTDHLLPAGGPYYMSLGSGKNNERATHLAVIQRSTSGDIFISEYE